MNTPEAHEALAWAAMPTDDGPLVMLVADLPDAMRFDGNPETASIISGAFAGAWFGAVVDGVPAIALGLVELDKTGNTHVVSYLLRPPQSVIAGALEVPHLVAVIPSDAPGVEAFGHDDALTVSLIEHATVVEVSHQSPSLAVLADAYRNDWAADLESLNGLVDLDDVEAVRSALEPVRSRVALAAGEVLTDNQIVPMAWRPWHYDLVEQEHIGGLHWQWPVIQIYFDLHDPTTSRFDGLAPPPAAQQRALRSFLVTVERLAGSLSVNSTGSIRATWTRENGDGPVEVDAPHADALVALLAALRLVFDPNEGSGLSFTHALNALSAAARTAGLTDLSAELKRWKKAHAHLCRKHLGELRHELAEELTGESLGSTARGPFPGAPHITPEQLIRTFMYGETLHRDEEKEQQIAAWDADAFWGPFMRLEVRSDAQGLVHFYGAFAGYVARWLDLSAA